MNKEEAPLEQIEMWKFTRPSESAGLPFTRTVIYEQEREYIRLDRRVNELDLRRRTLSFKKGFANKTCIRFKPKHPNSFNYREWGLDADYYRGYVWELTAFEKLGRELDYALDILRELEPLP